MACNCGKGKTGFQVIASNGNVVYESTSKATADAIGRRYPGSTVRDKSAPAPVAAPAPAPVTAKPVMKTEKTTTKATSGDETNVQ